MQWRCSWRTKWQSAIALILLLLCSIASTKGYPGALVFGGIWALLLLYLAYENYRSSLALSGDILTMKGSFGYKASITKQDLSSIHLGWATGFKKYPEFGFWLSSSDGTKVFISRHGWGHSKELFQNLETWIKASSVQLDEKTSHALHEARGHAQ